MPIITKSDKNFFDKIAFAARILCGEESDYICNICKSFDNKTVFINVEHLEQEYSYTVESSKADWLYCLKLNADHANLDGKDPYSK